MPQRSNRALLCRPPEVGLDPARGSEVLQKYEYGFGELNSSSVLKNNGRLESVSSWIGTDKQWTQKFQYDSVGRLKEAKETKGDTTTVSYKQVFDYDRFGNLFRKAASNPTTGQENPLPYTAIETGDIDPAKNRFTSGTGTAYDDKGQVITDNKFRALGLAYDANGRMVVASQANTPDAVSVYDALGNRVAEKVNDVWQFVIYDAFGRLVAEYGGISAQDGGGVKYYLQDWQGSVRAGVNAGGYVKSRTDHQAFGEDIASGFGLRTTTQGYGAPATNRQGYGLTEKDSATGLNHTWFRKNENRAGRWTSPDPYNGSASVGDPQSWNRYSYVENEPTNFVDPSGLDIASSATRYVPLLTLDPMGVAYYLDGMLSDEHTIWSILNAGAFDSIHSTVSSVTWEAWGYYQNDRWVRDHSIFHVWSSNASNGFEPNDGSETLERVMNCALGYFGIDPISVYALPSGVKWALIALAAGGIPKELAAKAGLRVFTQPGSSAYTSALRMLAQSSGSGTLRALATFGKKWAGPIAIASAVIDISAIAICTVWE